MPSSTSATTREWSTSAVRASRTSSSSRSSPPATAATAARSTAAAKTPSRSNTCCAVSSTQLVGPLDGGPQRAVAVVAVPARRPQQPEPVAEVGQQLGGGHGPRPRRGQLDGEGHAVEPLAQRPDGVLGVAGGEAGAARPRPGPGTGRRRSSAGGSGATGQTLLAGHGRAAPGRWPGTGSSGSARRSRGRTAETSARTCSQLSTTTQAVLVGEAGDERLDRVRPAVGRTSRAVDQSVRHARPARGRRQLGQPHAVGEGLGGGVPPGLDRQAGLRRRRRGRPASPAGRPATAATQLGHARAPGPRSWSPATAAGLCRRVTCARDRMSAAGPGRRHRRRARRADVPEARPRPRSAKLDAVAGRARPAPRWRPTPVPRRRWRCP